MEWMEAATRIVESMGTSQFPRVLAEDLRAVTPYDCTVIFGYVGSARPRDLHDDFALDRFHQEGSYRSY